MGYFQVRYNSRVVNYDRRGFIRLATGVVSLAHKLNSHQQEAYYHFLPIGIILFVPKRHYTKYHLTKCRCAVIMNWISNASMTFKDVSCRLETFS